MAALLSVCMRRVSSRHCRLLHSRVSEQKKGFFRRTVAKGVDFIKLLLSDYKAVAMDTVSDIKERPIKASFYISVLGVFGYAFYSNPDYDSFDVEVVKASNELLQLGHIVRNPESDQHLQNILRWRNQGILRRWNLVFFSLMWTDNYNQECVSFEAQCKHLKPRWLNFQDRIVDIGVFGRWYVMKKKMTDYDINPAEFDGDKLKNSSPWQLPGSQL
ncbi:mitochondrial import inner membrane translocase subunit Tim29-like [Ptychodera flava]|uniref:mitochondrial import inner membrane translocase subunit Tim29-like n=1 Tax=Ptychodera flava TaxID=63121 RepID=UPI00396A1259